MMIYKVKSFFIHLVLILLLSSVFIQSRAQDTAYHSKWTDFSTQVAALYDAGRFCDVIATYQHLVHPGDLDLYLNYKTLGFAFYKIGDTQRAVQVLQQCIFNQEFSGVANLKFQLNSDNIPDTLSVWGPLLASYDSLVLAGDALHNAYAISVWDSMRRDDLTIRNLVNSERDSARIRELYAEMEQTDELNFQRLKRLADTLGHFPGFLDIGRQRVGQTTWLLIHMLSEEQFAYTSKSVRNAYLLGAQLGFTIPFITDRRQVLLDQPSVYGMINKYEGDTLIIREIDDIAKLDERRAAWGLEPFCEYLKGTIYRYAYGDLACD